jgi:hypothetical protein
MLIQPPRTKEEQLRWELNRRARLAVLAIVGGVLYELSSVTLQSVFKASPTVGLVQGLTPALNGVINPTVSPRAPEVRFVSAHAFGLIASSAMAAVSVIFAVLVVGFLFDATRYRRPEAFPAAAPLVLFGGIGFALLSIVHEVASSIVTHNFATGHDFTNAAVDRALNTNTANVIITYVDLVVALAFGVGVVVVALNAMRAGLISRLLGIVGCIAGALFVLPLPLQIITALWLAGLGILLLGRWPGGDPPAWAAGEARPWPTQAELRAAKLGGAEESSPVRGRAAPRSGGGSRAAPTAAVEGPPEPTLPAHSSSNKRKRKRGPRS